MTPAEFSTWVNTYIKANGTKAITGAIMNEFGMKFLETFAHIDTPLLPYSITIANGDLVDLKITVTHGKGTWIPDFIMFDENGTAIYNEYYNAVPQSLNTIEFEFFDIIPATGNGYYKLALWKVIENVSPRFFEVFSSDFSVWDGDVPDGFEVKTTGGNPTCENDTDRAKMTADGFYKIILVPDLVTEIGREYRVTVTIDLGGLYIISGSNQVYISGSGLLPTYIVKLVAGATDIELRQYGTICIIDDLLIEEAS